MYMVFIHLFTCTTRKIPPTIVARHCGYGGWMRGFSACVSDLRMCFNGPLSSAPCPRPLSVWQGSLSYEEAK